MSGENLFQSIQTGYYLSYFYSLYVHNDVHSYNSYYSYSIGSFIVNTNITAIIIIIIITFILLMHYRYCKYQNLLSLLRLKCVFAFSITCCGLSKSFHFIISIFHPHHWIHQTYYLHGV